MGSVIKPSAMLHSIRMPKWIGSIPRRSHQRRLLRTGQDGQHPISITMPIKKKRICASEEENFRRPWNSAIDRTHSQRTMQSAHSRDHLPHRDHHRCNTR